MVAKKYIAFLMKKYILVVFVLCIVVIGLIFLFKKNSKLSTQGNNTNVEKMLYLETKNGSSVSINNPFSFGVPLGEKENVVEISGNDKYAIVYYKKDSSFLITVTSEPAELNRIDAEKVFLEKVGISKEDACKLNIIVNATFRAGGNASDAGNVGLSFCPGSKPFPAE